MLTTWSCLEIISILYLLVMETKRLVFLAILSELLRLMWGVSLGLGDYMSFSPPR